MYNDDEAPMVPITSRTADTTTTPRPDGGSRRRFDRPTPTDAAEADQHRETIEPMVPDMR